MANFDDGGTRPGGPHVRKWASVTAIFVGVLGVAVAAVFATGTQLVSSPMATAGTTTADPWAPRPIFLPRPVPKPGTVVRAQGANAEEQQAKNVWIAKATPPFQEIQEGMGSLGKALDSKNVDAMKKACRTIASGGEDLADTLPGPTDELTTEVEASVDEIAAMKGACLADPPDAAAVAQHAQEANNHMANVAKLAQG